MILISQDGLKAIDADRVEFFAILPQPNPDGKFQLFVRTPTPQNSYYEYLILFAHEDIDIVKRVMLRGGGLRCGFAYANVAHRKEVVNMAYGFTDSLYGVVMTLTQGTTSKTKTISGINSTDGEGAANSAALIQQFATLLAACVQGNLTAVQRNARTNIEEVS